MIIKANNLKILNKLGKKNIYLVDKIVLKKYSHIFKSIRKKYQVIPVNSGEKLKCLNELSKNLKKLSRCKCNKNSALVAIGGGSTLDFVGFIASIWMRGISWIAIPTTLLSQSDTCYGGKTAINFDNRKNLVGTIHNPDKIIIIRDFLDSLNNESILDGLSEIFKHALLNNDSKILDLYFNLSTNYNSNLIPNFKIIHKSLKIKMKFVKNDPYETKNKRIFLNLGHSVAHAIEQIYSGKISHGKALWWGLKIELSLGMDKSLKQNSKILSTIDLFIKKYKSYLTDKKFIQNYKNEILRQILMDKKNNSLYKTRWISMHKPGKYKIKVDTNTTFSKAFLNLLNNI